MSVSKVEAPKMGITYAPLNMSVQNLSLLTTGGGTSGRHTLTVSTAATIVMDNRTSTVQFIPANIPTWPIFIKFGDSAITAASATNFDIVLTPTDACVQIGLTTFTDRYSIFSATSQTVYTVERN